MLAASGIEPAGRASREPTVLFWGVPFPLNDPTGNEIRNRLIRILDAIGEDTGSRSEPDVILDFGSDGIVFIEVKHRSPNMPGPKHPRWPRYLDGSEAFRSSGQVQDTGLYELSRNWRIAWDMAADRCPIALVNLAPGRLFECDEGKQIAEFGTAINQNEQHQFITIGWQQFLQCVPNQPRYLQDYLRERGIA